MEDNCASVCYKSVVCVFVLNFCRGFSLKQKALPSQSLGGGSASQARSLGGVCVGVGQQLNS